MDAADRRLMKSHMELQAINRGLKRADGDQKKMNKELKKIRRYFKSPLAEVARLDQSIYNVKETTHEVDVNQGTEAEGTNPADGESA
tara:strand:- start:13347 stop:13607 length:261 start_codon:yes stop_codon:yes gene_type:complete